jgi:DNA-directed RNA polymerase specialized sigma24 family protein
MGAEGLNTSWIGRLEQGDPAAAQKLFEGYFPRLLRLAQKKLGAAPRRAADEEDVVLSAIHRFLVCVAQGRFPQLKDRHDLWRLLVTITARKAFRQAKYARRQKRGGGKVRGESVFAGKSASEHDGIDRIVGKEPTPSFVAEMTEQFQRLLDGLGDEILRQIAVLKLAAYTNEEIAAQLDCGLRTVERKLRRIRKSWSSQEGEP